MADDTQNARYEELIERSQAAVYLAETASAQAKDAVEKAAEASDIAKEQRVQVTHLIGGYDKLENNDKSLFKRVSKVEWLAHNHEETITEIVEDQEEISASLSDIKNTMNSIKWAIYGAVGFYFVNAVGIVEAIRLALGG